MHLPDRIRAARRLKRWSQAELAAQLGVDRSAVGHWERGQGSTPSAARMLALAEVTGVNFAWLTSGLQPMVGGSGHPPAPAAPTLSREEARWLEHFQRLALPTRRALLSLLDPPPRAEIGDRPAGLRPATANRRCGVGPQESVSCASTAQSAHRIQRLQHPLVQFAALAQDIGLDQHAGAQRLGLAVGADRLRVQRDQHPIHRFAGLVAAQ